ncbi:hypothetical protein GC176_11835 [bacterium]|nr:hypothetical protein [bacterium]
MTDRRKPNVDVPRAAKCLSLAACILTLGAMPFEFADWGNKGMLGAGIQSGFNTMGIICTWLLFYGGFVVFLANIFVFGTCQEILGRHKRTGSGWWFCTLHWIVSLLSVWGLEKSLKLDGFIAARAWQIGQVSSAVAATIYAASVGRQLRAQPTTQNPSPNI